MKKKLIFGFLAVILIAAGKYVYDTNINYNFKPVTEGKVYKSGTIPPEKLADYIKENQIKSVVDLRFPGTDDLVNNPEVPQDLSSEKEAVKKLDGVNYFHVGSEQIPDQQTLDSFFKVMDDSANYPVLIHCYHGEGRAILFSSIYRMEYENMSNEEARKKSRFWVKWGNFDKNSEKGKYVLDYVRRKDKK